MAVTLLVLGIVTAVAGMATVGFGIPINEFSLGTTLIVAGSTGLVGGLILIGLSAVVNELGQLAKELRTRVPSGAPLAPSVDFSESAASGVAALPTANQPSQVGVTANQPQPTPSEVAARPADLEAGRTPASVAVSEADFDRLRSSLGRGERNRPAPSVVAVGEEVPLSPSGAPHQMQQANEPVLREPKLTADDRAGAQAVEALKASRLDFLFRSKPPRPTTQPDGNFEAFWPADARSGRNAEGQTPAKTAEGRQEGDTQVQDVVTEPSPAEETHAPAILKSGIVDGMPYTLYADGSIEAKLPQGTVRFGSIAELRAHIESNS
jgi:hypothetical protein